MNLGMLLGEVPDEELSSVVPLMQSMLDGTLVVHAKFCRFCDNRLIERTSEVTVDVRKRPIGQTSLLSSGVISGLKNYHCDQCKETFVSRSDLTGSFAEEYLDNPIYAVSIQDGFLFMEPAYTEGKAVQEFSAKQKEGIQELLDKVQETIKKNEISS